MLFDLMIPRTIITVRYSEGTKIMMLKHPILTRRMPNFLIETRFLANVNHPERQLPKGI